MLKQKIFPNADYKMLKFKLRSNGDVVKQERQRLQPNQLLSPNFPFKEIVKSVKPKQMDYNSQMEQIPE